MYASHIQDMTGFSLKPFFYIHTLMLWKVK